MKNFQNYNFNFREGKFYKIDSQFCMILTKPEVETLQ